jgi:predicted secreted protein
MANAYKVLGQSDVPATTLTDVYTVPASTETVISTIIITNRSASARTYRIAIRPNGASISDSHYIAYDVPMVANDAATLTLGITLDAADVVSVYASDVDMTVNIFGTEITA